MRLEKLKKKILPNLSEQTQVRVTDRVDFVFVVLDKIIVLF